LLIESSSVGQSRDRTSHRRSSQVPAWDRRYPLVEVLPNRLFVDGGDILTSAG
jgi:transcriptional regulator GlxA family with amidase domain